MTKTGGSRVFGATRAPDEAWLARAVAEPVLDADRPIIDAHMHLWDHKTGYRYFIDEFAADVRASGHNVVATVYEECHSMYRARGPDHLKPVGETEFATGMAAMAASGKYTDARAAAAIVAFADLMSGDRLRETLDAHLAAANGRLRGIRQRGKWDADPIVRGPVVADRPGLYLEPEYGRGLDVLTAYGLAFDASIYHPQIGDVVALARAHPDATIVLVNNGSPVGHSSYAGKQDEVHAAWLAGMRELATCHNVSIKLGGLLMCLGNYDFTACAAPLPSAQIAELWRPYIEPCIELFGADRCMATSNFPVEKAGMTYGLLWNTLKHISSGCSEDEKNSLFYATAQNLYDISRII